MHYGYRLTRYRVRLPVSDILSQMSYFPHHDLYRMNSKESALFVEGTDAPSTEPQQSELLFSMMETLPL